MDFTVLLNLISAQNWMTIVYFALVFEANSKYFYRASGKISGQVLRWLNMKKYCTGKLFYNLYLNTAHFDLSSNIIKNVLTVSFTF